MIIPIKDLLNQVANENGHANWDLAMYRLSQMDLHELYKKAIHTASVRAFNKGWKERGSRVSYSKKYLTEFHSKEHNYLHQKLDEVTEPLNV